MKLKVLINDKFYKEWTYYDAETLNLIKLEDNFNPSRFKLFSADVFDYDLETKEFKLIHSVLRHSKILTGILIMNRTYGRSETDKLYYKCIPNDKHLPDFLIPVGNKIKNNNFIKTQINTYVIFIFQSWEQKHPIGQLKQTIGKVDELVNFFEYQLYCKNLNISIQKFNRAVANILKKSADKFYIDGIMEKYKNIENRFEEKIITIDPLNSQDFDDALSFKKIDETKFKISIYIANVAILIDHFNLWNSFSERISTIYLPDRKRPMLPTILSENLCSLKENESRIAFCIDLYFDDDIIYKIDYKNVLIRVTKNFLYEEKSLIDDTMYQELLLETKKISNNYKYLNIIRNSCDLVAYYMIFMNSEISKFMIKYENGIYRSVIEGPQKVLPKTLPEDIETFLKIFHSATGQYSNYQERTNHNYIANGLDSYLHITSPIRRLVDLLNLIKFQENLNGNYLSENAIKFYDNWFQRLDYINITMKAIKKVQNTCSLLYLCSTDPEILNQYHKGYVFDKLFRNDGLIQYTVYLPTIKMISKIIIKENLENYLEKRFKLYIFTNEHNIKKKIRLQIIE